jgi:hypothetical protein
MMQNEWMGSDPIMMEALTQAQRAARRWTFAKNKKLINIKKQRTQIRKKPYSVLSKRAHKLAYLYVRKEWTQRLFGTTPYDELSLPQKQRVSQMVQKKKRKVLKLAKFRFLPALKQKEADRFKGVHQYPSNLTFDTSTIDEVNSGFYDGVRGSMTPNDAAGATGYMYNHSWDEYDNQEYYLANLPGFELVHEIPSEFELERAIDQGIPLMTHGDGKTTKYNRILKADFTAPEEFSKSKKSIKKESKIPGGLSQGMSLSDIAKKHKVSLGDLTDEFKKGYKVEREHTTDTDIAKEIAMDHLFEDPKYYTKLKKIEETIQKVDNKWVVYRKTGGEKLGTHETYEEALKQLREIELDKFKNINSKIDELAPHGYPDQEWMDNHEKEMKKLRKQLDKQQKETYK